MKDYRKISSVFLLFLFCFVIVSGCENKKQEFPREIANKKRLNIVKMMTGKERVMQDTPYHTYVDSGGKSSGSIKFARIEKGFFVSKDNESLFVELTESANGKGDQLHRVAFFTADGEKMITAPLEFVDPGRIELLRGKESFYLLFHGRYVYVDAYNSRIELYLISDKGLIRKPDGHIDSIAQGVSGTVGTDNEIKIYSTYRFHLNEREVVVTWDKKNEKLHENVLKQSLVNTRNR